jgi:hypothetical protein
VVCDRRRLCSDFFIFSTVTSSKQEKKILIMMKQVFHFAVCWHTNCMGFVAAARDSISSSIPLLVVLLICTCRKYIQTIRIIHIEFLCPYFAFFPKQHIN